MSVRIVKDYWKNLARYEGSIKRSFFNFIKKFPNPDGTEEAYHDMIVKLMEINIFHKFQEAKLVFNDETLDQMKEEGLTDKQIAAKAKVLIQKRNININKKFDHFLHTWVRQILSSAYLNRIKESKRYTHPERMDEINSQNYQMRRKKDGYSSWEESESIKEKNFAFTEGRSYPHISERGNFHSDKGFNAEDEYSAKEMEVLLKEMLENEEVRCIIEYKIAGLNGVDIGCMLNVTSANISLILRNLKKRCIEKGLVS